MRILTTKSDALQRIDDLLRQCPTVGPSSKVLSLPETNNYPDHIMAWPELNAMYVWHHSVLTTLDSIMYGLYEPYVEIGQVVCPISLETSWTIGIKSHMQRRQALANIHKIISKGVFARKTFGVITPPTLTYQFIWQLILKRLHQNFSSLMSIIMNNKVTVVITVIASIAGILTFVFGDNQFHNLRETHPSVASVVKTLK